jgi:hypothetical protein
MALPNSYKTLLNTKEAYILQATERLNSQLGTYQNQLLRTIVNELLSQLDVTGGIIQNTTKNYRIVGQIDTIISDFALLNASTVNSSILTSASRIGTFNTAYFKLAVSGETLARIEAVKKATESKMLARLGYINERVARGGFLSNFTNPAGIIDTVSQSVVNSITSQAGIESLVDTITGQIIGDGTEGVMERRLRTFAHDMYQQYDRGYAGNMATEFGMEYFVYEGGLVEDSRDFCREMNGRVFHVSETEAWKTWTPAKRTRSFEPEQKDENKIPSYIDFAGYEPLIDLGGFNCRHNIAYISETLAFKLRPELKGMKF